MTISLLLGGSFGLAVCLLVYALVPPRAALAHQLGAFDKAQTRQRVRQQAVTTDMDWRSRAGRWLTTSLVARGVLFTKTRERLAICEIPLEQHLATRLTYGLVGGLSVLVASVVLSVTGVSFALVPTLGGIVLIGVGASFLPDLDIRNEAVGRRREMRRGLSTYLDLVTMSLAGGRGIQEALPLAASVGSGWAFEQLSSTIERAQLSGQTPWAALTELGERLAISELVELGAATELVAEDGAKVRDSLKARASSSRRRQLADNEKLIGDRNMLIMVATLWLAAGFGIFLLYPALTRVMTI
ncbi:MAG: type II secretion system protein [Actinomycetales bacterium]|nr:type II secretion system protein [Actinomycetales bacterium]